MSTPTYLIKANSNDENGVPYKHDRNVSWCVAFVRFNEPASMYSVVQHNATAKQLGAIMSDTKNNLMVIENDCVDWSSSGAKASFGKNLTLTFKVGDVYYPYAVAPGDWVCFWVQDNQDDIDKIVTLLKQNGGNHGKLNDWN